jgi:hypothetical protein
MPCKNTWRSRAVHILREPAKIAAQYRISPMALAQNGSAIAVLQFLD